MLDLQESLRAQLDQLDTAESHLQELTRAVEARRQNVSEAAERLTRKRSEAAKKLTAAVTKELGALRMERTRFLVEVSRVPGDEPYGLTGQDAVEFVFSANPGEPLKSLAKVASGGELSRVMLALKTILADTDRVPVLIFDEVDAGVGGAVAEVMGARLRDLSRHHQVLCVTHLPQVGSQAHAHYVVEKQVRQKRTLTQVRKLTSEEREAEIARMLAGVTVTNLGPGRDKVLLRGLSDIEQTFVNGDLEQRVPHNLNMSFSYVEGESLIMGCKGIAVSSGSACTSASLEPSYVLRALGRSDELAHSSLRMTIGRFTTEAEIDYAVRTLCEQVAKLRELSPLWEMYQDGVDLNTVQWAAH